MSRLASGEISSSTSQPPPPADDAVARDAARKALAEQFAVASAELCRDLRCSDVRVIDISGHSQLADYVVLATGTSERQLRTVMDDLYDLADERGVEHLGGRQRHSGTTSSWIAIDFIDVVIHLFDADMRLFYDLDSLHAEGRAVQMPSGPRESASDDV